MLTTVLEMPQAGSTLGFGQDFEEWCLKSPIYQANHEEGAMTYHYIAVSEQAFVQQLALAYVQRGFWYYVAGSIDKNRDVEQIDRKLIDRYNVDISNWARTRRKKQGKANVHYLRCKQFFVLIASEGSHDFFIREGINIRDIRKEPIYFAGHGIGCYRGPDGRLHVSVRIHPKQYNLLQDYFVAVAPHRSSEELIQEFRCLPFEPYALVRRQLMNILRDVNRTRRAAGKGPIPIEALRLKRRILNPFAEDCVA